MGTVISSSDSNGGILGGTYNLFDTSNTDVSKNIITYCYNLGTITAANPNQISSVNATVTGCYYLRKQPNTSGYGNSKFESNFKNTTASSVAAQLNIAFPNSWIVDVDVNNGYASLAWQKE